MKNAVLKVLHHLGRDIAPFPFESWYLLRNELNAVFQLLGITCVVDVGAHTGGYGMFLRSIGYEGDIVSFEPVARNFDKLTRLIAKDPKWKAYHYALGDSEGSQTIHVAQSTDFSSFLSSNEFGTQQFSGLVDVARDEGVEIRRLDSVLEDCLEGIVSPRIYLKLDTQGWDLRVLAGAAGVMDRFLALQTELSCRNIYTGMTSYLQTLCRLDELGFKPAAFIPVNRDADLGVIEVDCILVRKDTDTPPATAWHSD